VIESSMAANLRSQIELLEAACHRVLRGPEDACSLTALALALEAFHLPVTGDDPAIVRGLSNVAVARAAIVRERIESAGPALHQSIQTLCAALADLHGILDSLSSQ